MKHDRSFVLGIACFLEFVICMPAFAGEQSVDLQIPCAEPHLLETANVRGYVFKAYEDASHDAPGCVRIYLHGTVVYRLANGEGMTYRLGQPEDPVNKIPLIPNGSDLTGNGRPDIMVTSWSGGAHCCFTHYVFELEPQLRLIAKLEDGDTDLGHFEDLDHNGRYFYVTDEIWSYWPGSFAGSVSHKVILKWDRGRFRLDLERMRRPAPTPEQWKDALEKVDEVADDRPPLGVLWDTVLDLIYTGHSDLAWKFVKEANPNALKGNNPSLEDFCSMLKLSEYWPDLELTLKNVPDECTRAKGKARE
jgi:hypothetical protein